MTACKYAGDKKVDKEWQQRRAVTGVGVFEVFTRI
jgi:hypothetical protein